MKPIVLKLSTGRDDKGLTPNYHVYEGGGQVSVKNKRGESIIKNAIMGGNGTLYIVHELADEDEIVVLGKQLYDALTARAATASPVTQTKKGRK